MNKSIFDDRIRDKCGIFGVFGHEDAAALTALGLHALQHRGQESSGIVSFDGKNFNNQLHLGLVSDYFTKSSVINKLPGHSALGHVRYSTTGKTLFKNIQPLFADLLGGGIACAHNGNLTNGIELRKKLVCEGSIFQSTSDTEVILHLISTSKGDLIERLVYAIHSINGAYSLVMLSNEYLIGLRDPLGIRPLVIGKLKNSYILSSESCGLDIIGAELIRDVEPGEIVVINNKGLKSIKPFTNAKLRPCLFEYIYFSRPDSILEGKNVYQVRKNIGKELAIESQEDKIKFDKVVPIPDSGNAAALGFAEHINKPFEFGIIRNHYTGRTFIEPTNTIRHLGVKLKHNPNFESIRGLKIALIDDSIVRGTTSVKIVEMLRNCGVKEIHMRIASPPVKHPCYYGIDTPSEKELLASKYTVEEIAKIIGVDSLKFISLDGVYRALGYKDGRNNQDPEFTDHYFSGDYPVKLVDKTIGIKPSQLSLLIETK